MTAEVKVASDCLVELAAAAEKESIVRLSSDSTRCFNWTRNSSCVMVHHTCTDNTKVHLAHTHHTCTLTIITKPISHGRSPA